MEKMCKWCGKKFDISNFHKNKEGADGHKAKCKSCCQEYQSERKHHKTKYVPDNLPEIIYIHSECWVIPSRMNFK